MSIALYWSKHENTTNARAIENMTWTKPYYGVQHLNGLTRGIRQITVEDRETSASVWALGPQGFQPIWEEQCNTAADARVKGEAYAQSMGCLIGEQT